MAFSPLILRGNLKVNGNDVSDQVTSFTFTANVDTIDIPSTFGSRPSFAAGNDTYEVTIEYLMSNDATPFSLSEIFWDAIDTDAGTITVAGTLRSGSVSATNPLYTATAVVTGVGLGGENNTVGQDSQTFPLTDRPTRSTSAP